MIQTLTAKIRIRPNPDQMSVLDKTMDVYLAVCNAVSEYIFETKDLTYSSVNRALYYDLRSRYETPSQLTQSAIRAVIAAYKTMLTNGQPWTAVKFRHGFYDLVWNRDYSLRSRRFSINSMDGRLHIPYFDAGMEKYFDKSWYKFGSAKLIKRHGKYYLHISVSHEIPDVDDADIRNIVGMDRGINFIATTYDSAGKTRFFSGRPVKNKRARYRRLRHDIQKNRTRSARRKLKRINQRENRWASDINHRITKALVESNPSGTLFVLEDLTGIREGCLVKRRKEDRPVYISWDYFDFEQKLIYKAERAGSKVIKVDSAYTSQTCPKCGHTERSNRDKRKHLFTCKTCGYRSNDDRIGAMNLYRKGIKYIVPDTVTDE